MTRDEALYLASGVRDCLPVSMRQRLKAIDVCPKLHQGMLTIRVYAHNIVAADPPPFVFLGSEL